MVPLFCLGRVEKICSGGLFLSLNFPSNFFSIISSNSLSLHAAHLIDEIISDMSLRPSARPCWEPQPFAWMIRRVHLHDFQKKISKRAENFPRPRNLSQSHASLPVSTQFVPGAYFREVFEPEAAGRASDSQALRNIPRRKVGTGTYKFPLHRKKSLTASFRHSITYDCW